MVLAVAAAPERDDVSLRATVSLDGRATPEALPSLSRCIPNLTPTAAVRVVTLVPAAREVRHT
jgi:hypothetical protein